MSPTAMVPIVPFLFTFTVCEVLLDIHSVVAIPCFVEYGYATKSMQFIVLMIYLLSLVGSRVH